ncbi:MULTISPECIES: hypothetical protein [Bacillus cereus group]|uniref:hypothetical protein n=1 Tax=Bacillus cereus group TaxID=86661 RepID=UPI00188E02A0|nr:hypothetical protein [Bacillus cereus]
MNQLQEWYRIINLQTQLMDIKYSLDCDSHYEKENAVQELLKLVRNLNCKKTYIKEVK